MRKDDSNIWLVPSIAWWFIFDTNLSDQKSDPPCQCMQRAAFCSEPPVRRHYRLSFFDPSSKVVRETFSAEGFGLLWQLLQALVHGPKAW